LTLWKQVWRHDERHHDCGRLWNCHILKVVSCCLALRYFAGMICWAANGGDMFFIFEAGFLFYTRVSSSEEFLQGEHSEDFAKTRSARIRIFGRVF
jgi:hypothetical protein